MSTTATPTQADEQAERKEMVLRSEKLDETQIMEELKGSVIDRYFYEFEAKGKKQVGLSFSGVKFMARKMQEGGHPISVEHVETRESMDGEYWLSTAMAKDLTTGEKRWGDSMQPKVDQDTGQRNPFSYTLASSKAQRNALRHFLPETVIQEGYREWSSGGAGKAKPVNAKARKVNEVTAEELAYTLQDLEGVTVTEAPGELRVTPPKGKMLDSGYMMKLREALAPLEPEWVGRENGGPHLRVTVKQTDR